MEGKCWWTTEEILASQLLMIRSQYSRSSMKATPFPSALHTNSRKLVDWLQYLCGLSVCLYNFSQVDTEKTVNCRAY